MRSVQVIPMQQREYSACYSAMRDFTLSRDSNTVDQIWQVQHPPVYTLGLNSKAEHILDTGKIPIIQTDRGGQVTYHGPGQLVIYCLFELKKHNLMIKNFIYKLEQVVIDLLSYEYNLNAERKLGAPGVYINGDKISAIGLRVKRGCSYHGIAINVDMDLTPFNGIHPCGYQGLKVVQLADYGVNDSVEIVATKFLLKLAEQFDINLTSNEADYNYTQQAISV